MINQTIEIWKGFLTEDELDYRPILTTYILTGDKKRDTVLICPGGGYQFTSPREAEPIALKYNAAGFHAFVLDYSVAPARHPQPLRDVSRAMCIIRENAEKWQIDDSHIAVCGFSAGGHLTASLGVHWQKPFLDIPGIKVGLNRPDALILAYPVITSGEFAHRGSFENLLGKDVSHELLTEMSLEKQINKHTPPAFIWHTFADSGVPVENSLLFARGMREKQIPFELHIYPEGPHGLSLATEETATEDLAVYPHVATWMELSIEWLKNTFSKQ